MKLRSQYTNITANFFKKIAKEKTEKTTKVITITKLKNGEKKIMKIQKRG